MGKLYVRVDDRLIHGQTIVAWCPTLQIKEIIGIDDVSAKNPMLKSIMTMTVPKMYKTDIVTLEEAKGLLNEPSDKNRLVIVKYPHQVYELKELVKAADMIMLGNMAKREDTVHQLSGGTGIFWLSEQDVKELSEMAAAGFNVVFHQLPNAASTSWETFTNSIK